MPKSDRPKLPPFALKTSVEGQLTCASCGVLLDQVEVAPGETFRCESCGAENRRPRSWQPVVRG